MTAKGRPTEMLVPTHGGLTLPKTTIALLVVVLPLLLTGGRSIAADSGNAEHSARVAPREMAVASAAVMQHIDARWYRQTFVEVASAAVMQHIDARWYRQTFVERDLALWLKSIRTENGFFRTNLDRRWRPEKNQQGTLVSQTRPLVTFATGYELTGREAYLDAVREGADFLLKHFRDEEQGGWYWAVRPDGSVSNSTKDSYGHSFVIFGLSHAYRVTGDSRYLQAALDCHATVVRRFRDAEGGYNFRTNRDFTRPFSTKMLAPMLHLFEAFLALHDVSHSPDVYDDALALAEFVFGRLYHAEGAYLPEWYDADWSRQGETGPVSHGHMVEWAFLLSRAVEKGFPRRYLQIGHDLLDATLRTGYDKQNGGIFSAGGYDRVTWTPSHAPGRKGWWEQCELLRCLMRFAALHGRADLWPHYEQTLRLVKTHFIDHRHGGWFEYYDPSKPRGEQSTLKGNNWKVDYHVWNVYTEALQLHRAARISPRGESRAASIPPGPPADSPAGREPPLLVTCGAVLLGGFACGLIALVSLSTLAAGSRGGSM